MLFLHHMTYQHPNKDVLFNDLQLCINPYDKIALIGNNGIGKSTLLKIIAGEIPPLAGELQVEGSRYYVPQLFGQYNHLSVAQALQVADKLQALQEILAGNGSEAHFTTLNDDWTIEERCQEALLQWQLEGVALEQRLSELSGGQKTKVFLAGIAIHRPDLVLLDEPSNHLDAGGRALLYAFIQSTSCTLLVVSHDRNLLNLLHAVFELNKWGIRVYGGNYDFYREQKLLEGQVLNQDIRNKEKALRKAKEKEKETLERQRRLDARGKKKQERAGVARIMMNTLRNHAENSTSKLKNIHGEKINGIAEELGELRATLPAWDQMKFDFGSSTLHRGKVFFTATNINVDYGCGAIWKKDLSFRLVSGERLALKGANGSGKTTLIQVLLGQVKPATGTLYRAESTNIYVDQDYSLINHNYQVYEQVQNFNTTGKQEHELKIQLSRFLFSKDDWEKPCAALSGGEKMRLMLCCLTTGKQAPDLIILDEPTNNLDIQNIELLTAAVNAYQGMLLVVSHDDSFLEAVGIERFIDLSDEAMK